MAQNTESSLRTIGDLDFIVDTDAHVTDQIDDFLPYADDKYKASKKMIENAPDPLRDIYTLTHPLPIFQHSETYGGDDLLGEDTATRSKNAKLKEMDEYDIDYSILNPTLNLGISTVNNTRAAMALMNGYNSWITDEFLDEHPGLKATILVAPQKPDIAAEEIDRMADEDDMVGVGIPATGVEPPLGNHKYDPIYEAAEDNGLPLVLHGVSGAFGDSFPIQRKWNETYAEDHVIVHPFTQMWTVTSLMFHGIPERFPDLDFVIQEAGIGWVPYLVWRLDDHYLELSDEIPDLQAMPSAYIDEQFTFTTQPLGHTARNPGDLASMIDLVGPELVMYASDLPHPDFDPPGELFDRVRSLDGDDLRGMMGETAAAVYGLAT